MADKKKFEETEAPAPKEDGSLAANSALPEPPPAPPVRQDEKQEAPAAAPPQPLISFDRWFATTKRPAHHKAGMKAFASTAGRRTMAQWTTIFQAY